MRLALLRRTPIDRLRVSGGQLILLTAIDVLFALALDVAAIGVHGRFNLWGLPGTLFYLPYAMPDVLAVDWRQISVGAWIGITVSALLSINLSYILWNMAVHRLGSSRTAIYSNVIPVAAVGTAAVWLGEPVDRWKAVGAALIITGLVVATRLGAAASAIPAEE